MRHSKLTSRTLTLMIAYTLALTFCAAANIRINYLGKGSTWDLYPAAESFWVLCSIAIVPFCTSTKRLVIAIIALLFLDSWVDLCAMGQHNWWAGPPLLIEWKWDSLGPHLHQLINSYWAFTWAIQVPFRCLAMARAVTGRWDKQCFIITVGLNLIWCTAPQDVLYHFVWWGVYDRNYDYFSYLPPEGFWNLYNMLLLRVPIGVAVGALLIRAGRCEHKWSNLTITLLYLALSAIALYAAYFLFLLLRSMI